MRTFSKVLLLLLIAIGSSTPSARAEEVPPVVKALEKSWPTDQLFTSSYSSVTNENGVITISELKFELKGALDVRVSGGSTIDKITLSDVVDQGNGLFRIGKATFKGFKSEVKGTNQLFQYSMAEGTAEDLYLNAETGLYGPLQSLRLAKMLAQKLSISGISWIQQGVTMTIDNYTSTWSGDARTGAGKFTGKLSNIHLPESTIAVLDSALQAAGKDVAFKKLGYSSLTFDQSHEGEIVIDGNNLAWKLNGAIDGKGIGTISANLETSEIPVSLISVFKTSQLTGKEPDYASIMPELNAAQLNAASIQFTDSSITGKLLPLLAESQGTDVPGMTANAGAMVKLWSTQFKNVAFSDQVSAAVTAFLTNPKSLALVSAPSKPFTLQELMATNQNNFPELISKLGISVVANQ